MQSRIRSKSEKSNIADTEQNGHASDSSTNLNNQISHGRRTQNLTGTQAAHSQEIQLKVKKINK